MTTSSSKRRGPSSRPRQRRPSQRATAVRSAIAIGDDGLLETAAAAPSARSRRSQVAAIARPLVLPRDVEYAYISADLKRLLFIAGILLGLMVVILVLVGR